MGKMKKQPRFTYERESGVWAVIEWKEVSAGVFRGTKIETYDLKETARRRVYELNGWKWKS